jgi:hypothetical protein
MMVRPERATDRRNPCCRNLALVHEGKGPHAGELRCADCGRHRGWVSKRPANFLLNINVHFGVPTEPPVIRDGGIPKTIEPPLLLASEGCLP